MPIRQDLVNAAIKVPLPAAPQPQAQPQPALAGPGGPADRPAAAGLGPEGRPSVRTDLVNAALARPAEEVGLKERAMLSLIKEDPDLQVKYLQRQGFDARVENGAAKIRGTGGFVDFDPEGLDVGDFVDILPEAVEGVAGALATSAKVLGAVGAPATGGASLAAGAALGGAVTGGVETAKQGLAAGLGLREGLDPGRIGRQTAIGAAVPLATGAVVKGAQAGGRGLSKAFFGGTEQALKKDPKAIKEAFKIVGGKPTPGQLSDSPAVQATEEVLAKNRLGLGGAILRKQRRVNVAEATRTAEDLVAVKSGRAADEFETGKRFSEQVMKSINNRLKKAENLYLDLDRSLKSVPADTRGLESGLRKLESDLRFSDDGLAVLAKFRRKLPGIQTAEDLKLFRSSINAEIPPTASKNMRVAADRIYGLATKARTDSYDAAIKQLKQTGEPGSEKGLVALKDKLKEADAIYADTSRKVVQTLLGKGKKLKAGVRRGAQEALEKTPVEKLARKVLTGQDPDTAKVLKELSPEGFETLRQNMLARIAEKATTTAKGGGSRINPQRVAKEFLNMNEEFVKREFGEDALIKSKALQLVWRDMPPEMNPSGTGSFNQMADLIMSNIKTIPISVINAGLRAPKGAAARAALFTAASEGLDRRQGGEN